MKILFYLFIISIPVLSQTIVWNSIELPPSLITKGELKDKGCSDQARTLMSNKIKKFTYKVEYVNSARAINNLKTKENYCFSGLNKNKQREEFIYFSKPFMYSFPHEIVIKKEKLNRFKKHIDIDGFIDFEKLLQDNNLRLLYTKERAYSHFIDNTMKKFEKNENILYRPALDLAKSFLKMLEFDRADYIIEYPVVVAHNSNNEFITIPIKNSNKVIPVFIGCSKSEIGKLMIDEINDVILLNKELLASYYAEFLDKEAKQRYLDVQKY